jgi:RNA polymerase sigma factor (sigma-70 family)
MTDGELLRRYVDHRDAEAFAELVRRHGGMILAAARRLMRDEAEDIAQSVFLLLARKAPALLRHTNLAGWLYQTTLHCSANARRIRARHQRRIERMKRMPTPTPSAAADDPAAIRESLDDAMARLATDHRDVLVLRYLEGHSLEQAAERLGISTAAAAKRVSRGLEKLRSIFARQGLLCPVAAIASAMESESLRLPEAQVQAMMQTTASSPLNAVQIAAGALPATGAKVAAAAIIAISFSAGTVLMVQMGSSTPRPSAAVASAPASAPAPTSEAVALATARRVIAALRDGQFSADMQGDTQAARNLKGIAIASMARAIYDPFPQRIAEEGQPEFGRDQTGNPIDLRLPLKPPTEADVERPVLRLIYTGNQWVVSELATPLNDLYQPGPAAAEKRDPAAEAEAERRALSAVRDLVSTLGEQLPVAMEAHDLPRTDAVLDTAINKMRELQTALNETDLPLNPATAEIFSQFASSFKATLHKQGFDHAERFLQQAPMAVEQMNAAIGKAYQILQSREADATEPAATGPRPPAVAPDITVTAGWDGSLQRVPGPMMIPPWLEQTAGYRAYRKDPSPATLHTRDDAGNRYEIEYSLGADDGGAVVERAAEVRQYRGDGSLAASANYQASATGMKAVSWSTYDPAGTHYTMRAIARQKTDAMQLGQVTWFAADKTVRIWTFDDTGRVVQETASDPIGKNERVIHEVADRR